MEIKQEDILKRLVEDNLDEAKVPNATQWYDKNVGSIGIKIGRLQGDLFQKLGKKSKSYKASTKFMKDYQDFASTIWDEITE